MTQTAEKTDVQLAEEWHNMQMNAKANGNKIYRVIVQQRKGNKIYQTSFLEDGFRNKTEVKDFYMGDSHNGRQRRHFGNEELFNRIRCFSSDLVEMQDCAEFYYQLVSPMRYVRKSKEDYYKTEEVHPDWECVGTTNKHLSKTNNIKLISITEWK